MITNILPSPFIKRGLCLAAVCAWVGMSAPEVRSATITTENKVIYDIVEGTLTVRISDKNASQFAGVTADLVIPKTVTDPEYGAEYTVVAMDAQAFRNCTNLTSVTIEAGIPEVGNYTFSGCSSLTAVSLPETVTVIGQYSFADCSSLQSMTIPSGVADIQAYAFQNCTSLSSVRLPAGLTTVGQYAFSACGTLAAPEFPETLTTVGQYAFRGCKSLGSLALPGGVALGDYAFSEAGITSISWPDTAMSFGLYCFYKVTDLTGVTIPGWLTDVPYSMFRSSPSLETVEFSEGVGSIGSYAFADCTSLATIGELPESLETIKTYAFSGCTSLTLTDNTFPSEMTLIDQSAFRNCTSLGPLTLPGGASVGVYAFTGAVITSLTWPEKAMTLEKNCLGTQSLTEVTVPGWMPATVTSLFSGWNSLEKVTVEEGVTGIGPSMFYGCKALTDVSLPSTVTTIGNQSFLNCPALSSITLPAGLTEIGSSAFQSCSALTGISLPSTVTAIGDQAFKACWTLGEVTLPAGLTEFSKEVFSDCYALQTIEFPAGITTVGDKAFYKCTSLASVTLNDALTAIGGSSVFAYCSALETIEFPAGLTTIGNQAFYQCSNLTGITFPAGLTTIVSDAFAYCTKIGNIVLPAGVYVGDRAFNASGVSSITFPEEPCSFGSDTFSNNNLITSITFPEWMTTIPVGICNRWSALTSITMPDKLEEIADNAFYYCANLHDVTFPGSLQRIGKTAFYRGGYDKNPVFGPVTLWDGVELADNAFQEATITSIIFKGCATFGADCFKNVTTITEFTVPECLTAIPDGFFSGWTALEKVTLCDGLETIGKDAFRGCTKLAMVFEMPESLTSIGASAFYGSAITGIDWSGSSCEIGEQAFYGTKITTLEIPAWMSSIPKECFCVCSALTSLTWEDRTTSENAAQTVTLGNNCFSGCYSLASINMPPVESTFGTYCFAHCGATAINWTDAPLALGNYTFFDCKSLTSVTIPETVTFLPEGCFKSCTNLTEAYMPDNLTALGDYAFHLSGLESIDWPENITTLGSYCFEQCNNLTEVDVPATISKLPTNCFNKCKGLESVTLNDGLVEIGQGVFSGCTALTEIVVPSTTTLLGNNSFSGCTSLLKAETKADGLTFGPEVFNQCSALTTFIADGHIDVLGKSAFAKCASLSDFRCLKADDYIGRMEENAFYECTSLTEFPWLSGTVGFGDASFWGCKGLLGLDLPYDGIYTNVGNSPSAARYVFNCSSLEYLNFRSTGPGFRLSPYEIANAPLRAVSHCYATDIRMTYDANGNPQWWTGYRPAATGTTSTISQYTDNGMYTVLATPEVSKLYVERGQKWKFMEAGYGAIFDIMEMKKPEIELSGDIYSHFVPGDKVNQYKALIRWNLELNDLNQNGDTYVTVYRDGESIADIVFGQPRVTSDATELADLAVESAIAVDVTINGEAKQYYGDFDYYHSDSGYYTQEYAKQNEKLYFDVDTHKRLDSFDKYGYTSWFFIIDEFDSPDLNGPNVPGSYTYSAVMKGYDYTEFVNNGNLEPGTDGMLYSEIPRTLSDVESGECVIHTAVAYPSMKFDGLYTTDEVRGDIDRQLSATAPYNSSLPPAYKLTYELDPDVITHMGKSADASSATNATYIVRTVEAYELPNTTDAVSTFSPNGTVATGEIAISADSDPKPGSAYQFVTDASYRGRFGSPVVMIPDAPELDAGALDLLHISWNEHSPVHLVRTVRAQTFLQPSVSAMGYDTDAPDSGEYFIGVWRTLEFSGNEPAAATYAADGDAADGPVTTLVHHSDGAISVDDVGCETCATTLRRFDESDWSFTDVFEADNAKSYTSSYDLRLYVKVPDKMLRSSDKWMIADASASSGGSVSGLSAGAVHESGARYFDLQGCEVKHPRKGVVYVRLTDSGATKVVYQDEE